MDPNASQSRAVAALVLMSITLAVCDIGTAVGAELAERTISIVCGAEAASPVRIAADELAGGLGPLFPGDRFHVVMEVPSGKGETVIYLGTPASLPGFAHEAAKGLEGAEGYRVTTAETNGRTVGLIIGTDEQGVLHGVHGLLRTLGYSFALDGDIVPAARDEPFGFSKWDLADRPLVPRRLVFNWHNFLSGCSSWDLEDWNRWTTQSQKMGYNGIMVHAYGNNPMTGFSFEGTSKPVGYLSSTRVGRDWATMHVNDVRRLIGGEVFDGPTFGSAGAIDGTDQERTEAAQELMAGVFAHAERRGMDTVIAVDMDTHTANPQVLITKLPKHARFEMRPGSNFWLPRPDVAEGYGFYKVQLAHVLNVYPQLDTFVLWFRRGGTPMMQLKIEHLPAQWREEYEAIIAANPEAEKYWHSVGLFVLGKVTRAHRRALDELGRDDVTLGVGSWGFDLQQGVHQFMPKEVGIYPLDFEVLWKASRLESPGGPEGVARVAAHRPVYPILWAHHDDGTYVGPPYPPFENFYDLLAESKCETSGFITFHWTTRPLDLYFIGLSDAVWASTKNQSVRMTCRRLARDWLGADNERVFGEYLYKWLHELPRIGRDTSDFFIDRELKGYDEALASHRQRMALLDTIDSSSLTSVQGKRIAYLRGLERFILGIYENESLYRRALALQKEGDIAEARKIIEQTDVPAVIRGYADTSKLLGISRGEQGLIISLNLRWLTHYVCLKQQLGMAPIRINFAPTSHDLLAQSRGRFTYFIDDAGRMWDVRGEEETNAPAYGDLAGRVDAIPRHADRLDAVRRSGIESDQPIDLTVSPLMNRKQHKTLPGRYCLTLLMGESSNAFDMTLHVPGRDEPITETIAPSRMASSKAFDVELTKPGNLQLVLTPREGKVRISGLMLEPIE